MEEFIYATRIGERPNRSRRAYGSTLERREAMRLNYSAWIALMRSARQSEGDAFTERLIAFAESQMQGRYVSPSDVSAHASSRAGTT